MVYGQKPKYYYNGSLVAKSRIGMCQESTLSRGGEILNVWRNHKDAGNGVGVVYIKHV